MHNYWVRKLRLARVFVLYNARGKETVCDHHYQSIGAAKWTGTCIKTIRTFVMSFMGPPGVIGHKGEGSTMAEFGVLAFSRQVTYALSLSLQHLFLRHVVIS